MDSRQSITNALELIKKQLVFAFSEGYLTSITLKGSDDTKIAAEDASLPDESTRNKVKVLRNLLAKLDGELAKINKDSDETSIALNFQKFKGSFDLYFMENITPTPSLKDGERKKQLLLNIIDIYAQVARKKIALAKLDSNTHALSALITNLEQPSPQEFIAKIEKTFDAVQEKIQSFIMTADAVGRGQQIAQFIKASETLSNQFRLFLSALHQALKELDEKRTHLNEQAKNIKKLSLAELAQLSQSIRAHSVQVASYKSTCFTKQQELQESRQSLLAMFDTLTQKDLSLPSSITSPLKQLQDELSELKQQEAQNASFGELVNRSKEQYHEFTIEQQQTIGILSSMDQQMGQVATEAMDLCNSQGSIDWGNRWSSLAKAIDDGLSSLQAPQYASAARSLTSTIEATLSEAELAQGGIAKQLQATQVAFNGNGAAPGKLFKIQETLGVYQLPKNPGSTHFDDDKLKRELTFFDDLKFDDTKIFDDIQQAVASKKSEQAMAQSIAQDMDEIQRLIAGLQPAPVKTESPTLEEITDEDSEEEDDQELSIESVALETRRRHVIATQERLTQILERDLKKGADKREQFTNHLRELNPDINLNHLAAIAKPLTMHGEKLIEAQDKLVHINLDGIKIKNMSEEAKKKLDQIEKELAAINTLIKEASTQLHRANDGFAAILQHGQILEELQEKVEGDHSLSSDHKVAIEKALQRADTIITPNSSLEDIKSEIEKLSRLTSPDYASKAYQTTFLTPEDLEKSTIKGRKREAKAARKAEEGEPGFFSRHKKGIGYTVATCTGIGAAAGAALGPLGVLVGAAIGALVGLVGSCAGFLMADKIIKDRKEQIQQMRAQPVQASQTTHASLRSKPGFQATHNHQPQPEQPKQIVLRREELKEMSQYLRAHDITNLQKHITTLEHCEELIEQQMPAGKRQKINAIKLRMDNFFRYHEKPDTRQLNHDMDVLADALVKLSQPNNK